ncbi:DNA cytosine methyltransferase [Rhizobium lentis]|uniref:DNA cytosine methyltransferase n=1 Tax=Rhizobium lentis TaxID=1138194 RepID=UPI001C82B453|nr:DNA (cytosine-5-)-methyltransferase [Rhizobium lentis]MBX5014959.1 DNA (cytosine-5-)-methyltransferase [Rhizobium lentis]
MNENAAALARAKTEITKLRKAMTEKFVKLAREIEQLQAALPIGETQDFLVTRCGMSPSEINVYSRFSKRLAGYEQLLVQHSVPYDVIRGLVATNTIVRERSLAQITSGSRFDVRELRAIRRHVADNKLSAGEFEARRNRRMMYTGAQILSKERVADFHERTISLIEKIADLPDGASGTEASARMTEIATDAATLLPLFETIVGSEHPKFGEPSWRQATEPARRHAEIYGVLKRLAAASSDRNRLSQHAAQLREGRRSVINHLARYVGDKRYMSTFAADQRVLTELPVGRLKALELCAGAGGMALGLEAAGFDHVALIEYNKDAAATMRLNRPDWPVVEQDMTTIDFTQYVGKVDLVAGGLPCQGYSEEGNGKGKDDPRDLLLAGARAVRQIRPKAVLFENVRGALFGKHSDQIAAFLKELGDAGYVVQIVEVNAQDYGVPQNRPRIFFVGLQDFHMRQFQMPRYGHRRTNVGDVLYDLMAANGWSEVDDWAEYCRTVTFELSDGSVIQGAQASTLTGRKGKAQEKEGIRWARNGLSPAGLPDEAPTDALAQEHGPEFVPGITLGMRARIQDFPDDYLFAGRKQSVAQQIGNAVAPRMAQAAALALHEVITGYRFDKEAILWPDDKSGLAKGRLKTEPPELLPVLHKRELATV